MFNANPETKAGLLVLTLMLAVFFLGDKLGLIADKQTMLAQERSEIAHRLVNEVSKDVSSGNFSRIQTTLDAYLEGHPYLASATFSSAVITAKSVAEHSGKIVLVPTGSAITEPSLFLIQPIFDGGARVGTLEVVFSRKMAPGVAAMSNYAVVVLIFLFTAGGFLFHRAFLGRSKEELGVGGFVPERIKEAFDSLAEGVLILDETGRIAHANRAFKDSCRMQSYMLAGTWLHDLKWFSYTDEERLQESDMPWLRVLKTGEGIIGEKLTLRTDEDIARSYAVNCTPLHENEEAYRGVIVTLDNLTELEKRNASLTQSISDLEQAKESIDVENRELQLLASRDSLTNCLNRRSFTERYNSMHHDAVEQGSSLVCIMVDIDHFKRINDNYGHALGDKVIKFVARVLEQQVREGDLLGRYGGEEFCIVLESATLEQASAAAERMRRQIAEGDPSLFGSALRTTASFGVAAMDAEFISSDELIHRADKALYLAKESGRNKIMNWEAQRSASAEEEAAESVDTAQEAVVLRPFFGDASVTERDWQMEETADAFSGQLREYDLPVSREHFCEKSLFVDRANQALLLARREARVMAVMSLGVSIARQDHRPMDAQLIDTTLQMVAARLRDKLRTSDVVVVFPDVAPLNSLPVVVDAEMGVLLPVICDAEAVGWVAKRVQNLLQESLVVKDQQLEVSSHLGAAIFPGDASDGVSLVQAACVARFYCQEHSEKGGIEFSSGHFNAEFRDRVQLQDDMAKAIENDELELLFQPKVQIPSGEIVGFESLLRWNHPKQGILTPNEFLNIAERTRLINMIGDWVLRQSCRQIVAMSQSCSRPLTCAVNMSVVQLSQPDLVDQVMCALEEEGLEPDRLELELAEDALQGGLDKRFSQLTQLQSAGVKIAIDDFSAGCAGLNYLRNLPVDILKVDRYFVADIAENEHDYAIVTAILSMAKALNLRVIAEGVESQMQFDALGALDCREAQGYLFGRPVSADAARALLHDATAIAHTG